VSGEGDVGDRIIEVLRARGRATFEEIVEALEWEGDRRPLRRVLAEMVRRGVVVREPDYERRKMVFRLAEA